MDTYVCQRKSIILQDASKHIHIIQGGMYRVCGLQLSLNFGVRPATDKNCYIRFSKCLVCNTAIISSLLATELYVDSYWLSHKLMSALTTLTKSRHWKSIRNRNLLKALVFDFCIWYLLLINLFVAYLCSSFTGDFEEYFVK